ncbi:MAG: hypothetical protein HC802_18780 [Caldilineaceae bacterium]|nr:hypothetical protein [Caldilineaceae bacterium]
MSIDQFTAEPTTIQFGQSTTLRWRTQRADDVYLNWRGVAHQGEEVVAPIVTTSYLLHLAREGEAGETQQLTVVVEGDVPAPDTITRPPTVTLTPENIELLKRYPRPPRDNGRGLHFHLDLRDESIARNVARLKQINATWTLLYAQDELQAQRAGRACWEAGIMPVVRIGKDIDRFFDPVPFVEALQDAGVPPYVQIYNEPADSREWDKGRPDNYREVFAEKWARHAARVADAGATLGCKSWARANWMWRWIAVAAIHRPTSGSGPSLSSTIMASTTHRTTLTTNFRSRPIPASRSWKTRSRS